MLRLRLRGALSTHSPRAKCEDGTANILRLTLFLVLRLR